MPMYAAMISFCENPLSSSPAMMSGTESFAPMFVTGTMALLILTGR